MRRFMFVCLLVWSCAALSLASPQGQSDAASHESKVTIEGLVRDIACPIQNLEATATHLSMKCLRACAKNGSPLVILTKDGELYFPISGKMPDTAHWSPYSARFLCASPADKAQCSQSGAYTVLNESDPFNVLEAWNLKSLKVFRQVSLSRA